MREAEGGGLWQHKRFRGSTKDSRGTRTPGHPSARLFKLTTARGIQVRAAHFSGVFMTIHGTDPSVERGPKKVGKIRKNLAPPRPQTTMSVTVRIQTRIYSGHSNDHTMGRAAATRSPGCEYAADPALRRGSAMAPTDQLRPRDHIRDDTGQTTPRRRGRRTPCDASDQGAYIFQLVAGIHALARPQGARGGRKTNVLLFLAPAKTPSSRQKATTTVVVSGKNARRARSLLRGRESERTSSSAPFLVLEHARKKTRIGDFFLVSNIIGKSSQKATKNLPPCAIPRVAPQHAT